MRRITLTLTEEEREALFNLAKQERRNPRAQAALLLGDALERLAVNATADRLAPANGNRSPQVEVSA